MADTEDLLIKRLNAPDLEACLDDLSHLLQACVHTGANISFLLPFPIEESLTFWREKVLPSVRSGDHLIWVAKQAGQIVGTVQMIVALPPNQPHRVEVAKLMVHPQARRCGVARKLMTRLEAKAREIGRTLITLDTRTGDKAEPLYISLGFETAGIVPDFCLDPSGDVFHPTTYMYKRL